jgi:lipoprotein-releasing system permease protein
VRACLFLLRHYLFPKGGNLLSFALWVSVVSVALGTAQLILVLSVMSGFLEYLEARYTTITSQVVVRPRKTEKYDPSFRKEIESVSGVRSVTPFGLGQGMLIKTGVSGVNLEGIEWESSQHVTPWKDIWVERPDFEKQKAEPHWIWLGKQLADKVQAKVGDEVQLLLPDEKKQTVVPFRVTGIIKYGIYEQDRRHAIIDMASYNEWFGRFSQQPWYKIKLADGAELEKVALDLREVVDIRGSVQPWYEFHQNVFHAVQHQKKMLFVVLEIIVALAALNVINLLMMSAHHRKRDMAILRAMGFRYRSTVFFFVAQGAAVGISGILFGTGLGWVTCRLFERFQPAILSEEIYNVTRLPLKTNLGDVAAIGVVAFFLCVVFSVLPALKAASQRPVEALRYE